MQASSHCLFLPLPCATVWQSVVTVQKLMSTSCKSCYFNFCNQTHPSGKVSTYKGCISAEVWLHNPLVIVFPQANIRLMKAGLKLVGAMCSCGSDVVSVLIVSFSLFCFSHKLYSILSYVDNSRYFLNSFSHMFFVSIGFFFNT